MTKKKRTQTQASVAKTAFSTNPFAALKGLSIAEQSKPETAKPITAPKPSPDAAADDLFRQAMAGVRPLAEQRPAAIKKAAIPTVQHQKSPRVAPSLPRDEVAGRKTFLQELEKLKLDVRFEDRLPEDDEVRPLPGNRLRQLKRGIIRLDRQLDLHGLTREEALEALPRFLGSARQAGEKGVLVITGQGLHSPEGPVLQQAVAGWLRDQGRALVLEYAPAPQELGGSGALVVFIRPLDKPVKE